MDGRLLGSFAVAALLGALVAAAPAAAEEVPTAKPPLAGSVERVAEAGRVLLTMAEEFPTPPLYQLLPHDYPYPLIRICYTYAGICLIPFTIQPGTPCECVASNGVRVSGVCTK